ncbi:endo-1,4-beta-xylanase [uncultured Prevotella sp.]|uniref:endo-1,4-beta-xylanase n=2 Tax=Prevotella TaxID=838 RepID=UPI00265CD441|nr:endo-1,4-beta-xylanase [uncultured Prevotella sp.]
MKMKRNVVFLLACMFAMASALPVSAGNTKTLKDVLGRYFLVGAAMNVDQIWNRTPDETNVVKNNFNSIVAENCMKGEEIHPEENRFFWDDADRFVKFGQDNGLAIIGHCLVWHSQPPVWMFTDERGDTVSRDVLIDRMHRHISAVVGRYKGRILGWDVVNEIFNDDGTFRNSPYYRIIGPEFVELAFKFAHEADPNAELYINDYSLAKPAKRDAVCRIVRELKSKGYRVDGIGMQSHNGLEYPDLDEYEKSIDAFAACGVKVMITELDVNVLPNPEKFGGAEISQNFKYADALNPYKNGLPEEVEKEFEKRYLDIFNIYYRHRGQISRVTLWGVTDTRSWLNDFPVPGRVNYPLLFDRSNKPKPVVDKIIKIFEK